MSKETQTIELLPTGRDFVDADGDVHFMADLTSEMEPRSLLETERISGQVPQDMIHAVRGLKRSVLSSRRSRRGGRSFPEISGREIGTAITNALDDAAKEIGRELTDDEEQKIARHAELQARGIA